MLSLPENRLLLTKTSPADQVLSAKLGQEKQLELDNEHSDQIKGEIDDFLANNAFKAEDKPGTHQVVLSRTFGNEV